MEALLFEAMVTEPVPNDSPASEELVEVQVEKPGEPPVQTMVPKKVLGHYVAQSRGPNRRLRKHYEAQAKKQSKACSKSLTAAMDRAAQGEVVKLDAVAKAALEEAMKEAKP